MRNSIAIAPAKAILFGEHAVVYGEPSIAIPLPDKNVKIEITSPVDQATGTVRLISPQNNLDSTLMDLPSDHPLREMISLFTSQLHIGQLPACTILIQSTIPVSSGLGSGAAVSVALIRALSGFLEMPLEDSRISEIAFEMEKIHHGNPSGIDNTVIAYEKPILFVKGEAFKIISIPVPLNLVIAGNSNRSNTKAIVSEVREQWLSNKERFDLIFNQIGQISRKAKISLENGDFTEVGNLMNENQYLLEKMGVSSPSLENLISTARNAGALGAKLSGAGKGGNIIALVDENSATNVIAGLKNANPEFVFSSVLSPADLKEK